MTTFVVRSQTLQMTGPHPVQSGTELPAKTATSEHQARPLAPGAAPPWNLRTPRRRGQLVFAPSLMRDHLSG